MGGKVSIIISIYNGQRYLKESLDSLLAQTYQDLEIIIINDGSTDLSRSIIDSYNDKRIIFIDRTENLGLTKSLNEGLSLSKGKYITRQDADDISFETRIEEQVKFLENNEEISVLGTGVEQFTDGRGKKKFIYCQNSKAIKSRLFGFINPLPHSTLMFRRQVLDKIKGYNNFFVLSQDYDFLLRASEFFEFSSLQKALVKLRFNPNSLTYTSCDQLKFGLAALICAHRRLMGLVDYSNGNKQQWQLFLGKVCSFINHHKLDKKFRARKYMHSAWFSLMDLEVLQCLKDLWGAFRNDKLFFIRRGIGLNPPDDIEPLLVLD